MPTRVDTLHTVFQADARVLLLEAVNDVGQIRTELEDRTGIPRATVSRNLKRLTELGCVAHRDGRYEPTPLGSVVAYGIGELREAIGAGDDPIELVCFLLRAESRVAVLHALDEGVRSRFELIDATGIPRTTVRRILADLREQEVVRRDGHEYRLTTTGRQFVERLAAIETRIETMQRLRGIEPWLPTEAFDFDLETLADAEITLPDPAHPLAPIDWTYRRLLEADRFWMLSDSATPDTLEACWRAMTTDRCEVVVSADLVDVIAVDTRGAGLPPGSLQPGGLYIVDRPIPCSLAVADDTVLLRVHDDAGSVAAVVESDAPAVQAWTEATRVAFDEVRESVDPAEVFPSLHPATEVGGPVDPDIVAMIRRVYEDAWGGQKDLELIDDYVGEPFARHMPYNPDVFSAAEYKALIARYHEAFPDTECTVEEIVPQGDRYFFRWRAWAPTSGPSATSSRRVRQSSYRE